jgi:hypothetical protein
MGVLATASNFRTYCEIVGTQSLEANKERAMLKEKTEGKKGGKSGSC